MNANWPEITSNLLPGQTAYDRPELCCRVFNMKLEEIMAGLKSCKVFGPYMAHLGVIEFQKRCYPHAHLVYTFTSQGPQRMNEMDKWVWARIPDENIANGLLRGNVLSSCSTSRAALSTSILHARSLIETASVKSATRSSLNRLGVPPR